MFCFDCLLSFCTLFLMYTHTVPCKSISFFKISIESIHCVRDLEVSLSPLYLEIAYIRSSLGLDSWLSTGLLPLILTNSWDTVVWGFLKEVRPAQGQGRGWVFESEREWTRGWRAKPLGTEETELVKMWVMSEALEAKWRGWFGMFEDRSNTYGKMQCGAAFGVGG